MKNVFSVFPRCQLVLSRFWKGFPRMGIQRSTTLLIRLVCHVLLHLSWVYCSREREEEKGWSVEWGTTPPRYLYSLHQIVKQPVWKVELSWWLTRSKAHKIWRTDPPPHVWAEDRLNNAAAIPRKIKLLYNERSKCCKLNSWTAPLAVLLKFDNGRSGCWNPKAFPKRADCSHNDSSVD